MKAVGIVVEYNPFHNGHLHQVKLAKKLFKDAVLVVAMSGNFLQRGEPAILDKWTRAKQALSNGVDLVIEVPPAACVQPADRFAMGAIRLLADLGVSELIFGAEHAEYDFMAYAKKLRTVHGDFTKYDQSYAASFQQAITAKLGHRLDQPNDVLGLAYAKANDVLGCPLHLNPIQRTGANYHDTDLKIMQNIASASAIRNHVLNGTLTQIQQYVPQQTYQDLMTQKLVTWDDYWPYLRYALLRQTPQQLQQIYGMAEGIEYRLQQKAQQLPQATFDEWLKAVKSKRFTYTRLSRLAQAILVNLTPLEVANYHENPYMRLLGFTDLGRAYLSEVKKSLTYPLYTKVSKDDKNKQLSVDYRIGKIYQLVNGKEQDLKCSPIWLKAH